MANYAELGIRNHCLSKVFIIVVNYAENATQSISSELGSIGVKGNLKQFEKKAFFSCN
jgi:hypothetical protein